MSFLIKCRTGPAGQAGPLLVRYDQRARILSLHVNEVRPCPLGLNLDATIIFDMQADGGVDGVEILHPIGKGFISRTIMPGAGERYWRLFLNPSEKEVMSPEIQVSMERVDAKAVFRFSSEEIDTQYSIGPGAAALVGANALRGLSIELSGFSNEAGNVVHSIYDRNQE